MSIELTELGYGKVKIEYMAGRYLDSLVFFNVQLPKEIQSLAHLYLLTDLIDFNRSVEVEGSD